MKKIIIVSDTHYYRYAISKLQNILYEYNPDILIHLGDDYEDTDELQLDKIKLYKVPGVNHPKYIKPEFENRILFTIDKIRFFISHTEISHSNDIASDIKPENVIKNKDTDIFCFGHSHIFNLREESDIVFLNPGHCKMKDSKTDNPPTFAIVQLEDNKASIEIRSLIDNKVLISLEKKFN